MSSYLMCYSILYELNTLHACWIAVDVWSNSSRWNRLGLFDTDVMPIFMIIALDIFITMHFSINCLAVFCSPTVIHAIMREATSETYAPRVSFLLYCISFIITSRLLFCNLYFPTYTKSTKNIYLIIFIRSHFRKCP